MKRRIHADLDEWLRGARRKPMILRGARQVGKTWLVRDLAQRHGRHLLEINFERSPQKRSLFGSNDPRETWLHLGADHARGPEDTLLFLDEIQAAPELIAKLRWFAEEMPELAIISAGSLLEFTLSEHKMSMPVGRISFMHVEPLSFEEFLEGVGKAELASYLQTLATEVPKALHEELLALVKEYTFVGGMPEAVQSWSQERSLRKVQSIHEDLIATYRTDFSKYKGKLAIERLDETLLAVPRMLGRKFVYSKVNASVNSDTIKTAVELLNLARVAHKIVASSANGIPLGSEIRSKFFKEVFLDIGLSTSILGTPMQVAHLEDISLVNAGAMAEGLVGQMLRTLFPAFKEPSLFYWLREERGSEAEIDYVIEQGGEIIPIEVKAGKSGTLKSLHLFMELKGLKKAIRVSSAPLEISKLPGFDLLSIPFYLVGQIPRLVTQMF